MESHTRVRRFTPDNSLLISIYSKQPANDLGVIRISGLKRRVINDHQNFCVNLINDDDAVDSVCDHLLSCHAFLGVLCLPGKGDSTSLVYPYGVFVTDVDTIGILRKSKILRVSGVQLVEIYTNGKAHDDVILETKRLLTSGSFFYAIDAEHAKLSRRFNLTMSSQIFYSSCETKNIFYWNRSWSLPLLRGGVDINRWIPKLICGAVETFDNSLDDCKLSVWILSRMSVAFAGTRFSVRGLNDYGYVANFVESEQLVIKQDGAKLNSVYDAASSTESSFLSVRGSIPLFWHQSTMQVGDHRIYLSRPARFAYPSFVTHFNMLLDRYGSIMPLSLVAHTGGQGHLNTCYVDIVKRYRQDNVCGTSVAPVVSFDYHDHLKNVKSLNHHAFVEQYMLLHLECFPLLRFLRESNFLLAKTGRVVLNQTGVVRINCIDCSDRTNVVQMGINKHVLMKHQIPALLEARLDTVTGTNWIKIEQKHGVCWGNTGDCISKLYTGSGALTNKSRTLDLKRSLKRAVLNNFYDSTKNVAIESMLLSYARNPAFGKKLAYHFNHQLVFGDPNVIESLIQRSSKFSQIKKLRVSISTWNINGDKYKATETNYKKDSRMASLSTWLVSGPDEMIKDREKPAQNQRCTGFLDSTYSTSSNRVDIFAIGFQEICDITASSLVKASEENMRRWTKMVREMLHDEKEEYHLLTSAQMVGVCMLIFVHHSILPNIRHLCKTQVKAGFKNAVGNKGCVVTRFCVNSTSLCFICSHFTAGQSPVLERNGDFKLILERLTESFKLPVEDHDYVFFFGDFNYRINAARQDVLKFIEAESLTSLLEMDQLKIEQMDGNVFVDYIEGPILFKPTYKYDYLCQIYDTSEKQRNPAWTDRVLWKRNMNTGRLQDTVPEKLLFYGRAELMTSDHRPVTALLDIASTVIDQRALIETYKDLRRSHIECCVELSTETRIPRPIFLSVRSKYEKQVKDIFGAYGPKGSKIVLNFMDPVDARMFVECGDTFEDGGVVFKKRLGTLENRTYLQLASDECDLMFEKFISNETDSRLPSVDVKLLLRWNDDSSDDDFDSDSDEDDMFTQLESASSQSTSEKIETTSVFLGDADVGFQGTIECQPHPVCSQPPRHDESEAPKSSVLSGDLESVNKNLNENAVSLLKTDWTDPIISLYSEKSTERLDRNTRPAKDDFDLLGHPGSPPNM